MKSFLDFQLINIRTGFYANRICWGSSSPMIFDYRLIWFVQQIIKKWIIYTSTWIFVCDWETREEKLLVSLVKVMEIVIIITWHLFPSDDFKTIRYRFIQRVCFVTDDVCRKYNTRRFPGIASPSTELYAAAAAAAGAVFFSGNLRFNNACRLV